MTETGTVPAASDSVRTEEALPLYRYFTSTVALITSGAAGSGTNVMACEWTFNVSYRPLRMMSLVKRGSYTHELISACGEFGVNMCSDEQAALASYAGNSHGREVVKLDDPLFAGKIYTGKRIGVPMLRGCVLNLECVVESTVEIGEHTGFVGRAVAGLANRSKQPLLYNRGRFFRLGDLLSKPSAAEPATGE
jgi:flavin reductase (DIM6/NTAB) family NADH-FMN oxidoreductase RutF